MELHRRLIEEAGGAAGIRDLGALESALAQPKASFGQRDLCRSLSEKATALCFSRAQNHPFMDGNKCVSREELTSWVREHSRERA